MDVLLIIIGTLLGYLLMYQFYGRFISKIIFKTNSKTLVPSKELEDGIDYVPTKKQVIFGHHFTSIAGTGPIVGPAIAIIWGWVPALIWVFVGSIFMGAIHDFGALIISMRNQGKSISEYTAKYVSPMTRILFFLIVFLELWIVIAIFGMVIAIIFNIFPASVFPVWIQIVIAVLLGMYIKKGKNITLASLIAVAVMYFTIIVGVNMPVQIGEIWGIPATGFWTIILLIYAFIASVLPVTVLLQPRDFINAYQLIIAMALLVLGIIISVFVTDIEVVAPAVQWHPLEAPAMIPFLFITIACGAISGFHALVSSGTSAKQVSSEGDALFVGFGSMLTEGVLAVIVIIAVSAGIGLGYSHNGQILTGVEAWNSHYSSWGAGSGLNANINAFVVGSSNMAQHVGLPYTWVLAIMGVFVASFAGTTLDTATRIQRYIITELFTSLHLPAFKNMYVATFFAVFSAGLLAFASGADGKGALSLWPLFGAVNQTLAALALIVVTLYLKEKGGASWLFAGIPAVFMIVMTLWASILIEIDFIKASNYLLSFVNFVIILIVLIIVFEGIKKFIK